MKPDVPSDPTPAPLELPRGPMWLSQVGEGLPVLLIHGVPGNGRDWRWMAPCLEPHRRVLRPDLPGFGETPLRHPQELTLEGRAQALLELVEAMDLQRLMIVGHSMGGPVAIRLATLAGERVTALGLIASPGLTPHRSHQLVPIAPSQWLLATPPRRRVALPLLKLCYRAVGFPRSVPDHEVINSTLTVTHLDFEEMTRNAKALTMPTLMSWAQDDPLVQAHVSEGLAEVAPQGPRLRYEQGGHNLQKTRAIEVSEALLGMHSAAAGVS